MKRGAFALLCCLALGAGAAYAGSDARIEVRSSAFDDGAPIPARHSFAAENISPPLSWGPLPGATQSVAVICVDPDAPRGAWTHWIVFNVPAGAGNLPEDLPDDPRLPDGSLQGTNDFGAVGWDGPAPPKGTHRYVFHVYALDTVLPLEAGAGRPELLAAMKGHVLAQGQVTGTYTSTRQE